MSGSSKEDEIASILEECLTVFRSGLLQGIKIDDLVFEEEVPHTLLSPDSPPPLKNLVTTNTQFMQYQDWIETLTRDAEELDCEEFERCRSIKHQLLNDLRNEWTKLEELKLRAWQLTYQNASLALPPCPREIETSRHFNTPLTSPDTNPTLLVVYILVTVMHMVSGLSLRDCDLLLFSLRILVSLPVHATEGQGEYISQLIPKDTRTVVRRLALNPIYKSFITCPECSSCYPDSGPDSLGYCSWKHAPTASPTRTQETCECGCPLRKSRNIRGREYDIPVRRFFYHDFNEWLGELLCRPGMEDMMDREYSQSRGGVMDDIWDAPGLYEISGPDGHPFIRKPQYHSDNEGRYLFSFNMDGFNPFQLKQAGRSASVMGLYLVCLNLPPKERFKMENMFLAGVIPGPKEPSLQEINHFLKPLVDDLLGSYVNGVRYSRTWKYPNGRNTRSALALIICDLPATRQAIGFSGSQSTNFCSYCKLQLKNINDLDVTSWEPRSDEEHRREALKWQSASEAERAKVTNNHGVRFDSEFLRLPYFNPVQSVCIDPMHAFFLRILSRHCQDIWGMDARIEDGDGLASDPVPFEIRSSSSFKDAFLALRKGPLDTLKRHKVKILRHLAADQSIPTKGKTRAQLMYGFTQYRRDKGWFDKDDKLISPLTTQEQDSIDALAITSSKESPISVLDAYTAMEFYLFADSAKDFKELSLASLAHLVFVNVHYRCKPIEYNAMNADEKQAWNESKMKKARGLNSKEKMIDALMAARRNEGITDTSDMRIESDKGRLSRAKNANSNRGKTRVLGRSRLQEIWRDMKRTTLPSCWSPAPPRIGDKGQGKISADGWRVFSSVHLIVTLGRIWGSLPRETREHQLFSNFCDLIGAVKIATGRSITVVQAEEYRYNMLKYLSGLGSLFPMHRLAPYHHISIHLSELLSRFGPTTTWRCWVFERYNHMLQNIETNGRFGELEKTLFERMCITQRLKGLISSHSVRGLEHQLKSFADRVYDYLNPTVKGVLSEDLTSVTIQRDIFQGEECCLEKDILRCLEELLVRTGNSRDTRVSGCDTIDTRARQYNKFTHRSALFSPSSFSLRDSHVVVGGGIPGDWYAGRIKQIFEYPFRRPSNVYFAVQRFRELSAQEALQDPYRRYPLVGGRLYHPELEGDAEVVPLQEIIAHFAHTPQKKQDFGFSCFHALPLGKVRLSPHRTLTWLTF